MKQCGCGNEKCNLQWKINVCQDTNKITVYIKGFDKHSNEEMLKGLAENSSRKAKIMSNEIHIKYKEAILKILNEDPETTTKKVNIKIYK